MPVDATDAMVRATDKVNFENEDTDGTIHNVWNTMLAAAPTPSATPSAASIAWNALRNLTDPLGEDGVKIMGHVRIYAQRQYEAGLAEGSAAPPIHAAGNVLEDAGGANWQDISTAPKDGTRFVAVGNNYGLYSETQHTCIAQWFRGCWMEVSDWNEASELKYLTHWMPLPPLPGSAARAPADSVLEDAARWQMAVLVGNEVMLHPDKRSNPSAVKAYMDAVHSGLDLTGAVDAARKQGANHD